MVVVMKTPWLVALFVDFEERNHVSRAYGMDIRVIKNDDGTLSVYEAFPNSGLYAFVARDEREPILKRYDVSGSIRRWLESN